MVPEKKYPNTEKLNDKIHNKETLHDFGLQLRQCNLIIMATNFESLIGSFSDHAYLHILPKVLLKRSTRRDKEIAY